MFDKYRIVEFISSGGKGRVYKVHDTALDKVVALKVLGVESDRQSDLVRFQSEARMASKLQHPNIATVLDFGLWKSKTPYLAMEFVAGETLQDLLTRAVTLELSDFCEIFLQVCYALDYAHVHDIVHRDIKPANIMISESEAGLCVKILDFGVAKRVDNISEVSGNLTASGKIIGSPCYMSPEQSRGQKVTQKSDNYSLGCVMWECLTGEPPFVADSALATLLMHQNASPGRLKDLAKVKVSDQLAELVEALLSKQPEERPGINNRVTPLLQKQLRGLDSSEKPLRESGDTQSAPTRRITHFLILGSVVLIALIFVVWGFEIDQLNKNSGTNQQTAPRDPFKVISEVADEEKNGRLRAVSTGNETVNLSGFATDSDLIPLARNQVIRKLIISNSGVTNAILPVLASLPNIKYIRLNSTKIDRLDGFEKLENLRHLEAKNNDISDEGLKPIAGKSLGVLDLSGTLISDRSLPVIASIKPLKELRIINTQSMEFDAVEALGQLRNLKTLDVSQTKIRPSAVRKIMALCPGLEHLYLNNCPNIDKVALRKLQEDFIHVIVVDGKSLTAAYKQKVAEETKRTHYRQAVKIQAELIRILERHEKNSDGLFRLYLANARMSMYDQNLESAESWLEKGRSMSAGSELRDLLASEVANSIEVVRVHGKLSPDLENRLVKDVTRAERVFKGQKRELAIRVRGLGDHFRDCGRTQDAIKYYEKCLRLFEQWKSGPNSNEYWILGAVYIDLADLNRVSGKYSHAKAYYNLGLKVLDECQPQPYGGALYMAAKGFSGYAATELHTNNVKHALQLSTKALQIVDQYDVIGCKSFVYNHHGLVLQAAGRNAEAKVYFDKSKGI
ncbi:MAG: protein kinase [Candidatus Obscuribacterales bacterium]|nr:protein kinase [Candidatus Obscuribacterales bacterium]